MDEKQIAAESAVELVKNGMVIGLGSGSTAEIAIRILGDKVKDGLRIIGVPTSQKSEQIARGLGKSGDGIQKHQNQELASFHCFVPRSRNIRTLV